LTVAAGHIDVAVSLLSLTAQTVPRKIAEGAVIRPCEGLRRERRTGLAELWLRHHVLISEGAGIWN
jgi:hypothetical protein